MYSNQQHLLSPTFQKKRSHIPGILFSLFCFALAFSSLYFIFKDSESFREQRVGGNAISGLDTPTPSVLQSQPNSVPVSPAVGPTAPLPGPSPMMKASSGNGTPENMSPPGSPGKAADVVAERESSKSVSPTPDQEPGPSSFGAGPSQAGEQQDEEEEVDPANAPASAVVLEMPPEAQAVEQAGGTDEGGVMCNDAENGYEAQYGMCRDIRVNHEYQRTQFESTYIPMVVDITAKCKKDKCTHKDKFRCCKFRRRCSFYKTDVSGGCTDGKVVNIFEGAFCRTFPCTSGDADICCVPSTGAIFRRTDKLRSKYARTAPADDAPRTVPHISFGYGWHIWTDESQKTTVGEDEWVPLVNFMDTWGDGGKGWADPAWIKFSKKGKAKYEAVELSN